MTWAHGTRWDRPEIPPQRPARDVPDPVGPSGRSPIRVALVDDHHLVREGLQLALETEGGFEVVGQAASLEGAFELATHARPDVLLLDLQFPEGDGMSMLRTLATRHPDLRVIVLTMDRGPETVRQALVAGAAGYLVKGAHTYELFEAIRAVARGERYLHSSVTGVVVDDSVRWTQSGGQLSAREREIVGHLAAGRSPAEVGAMLGISIHTVRRHIVNISNKLGIRGRASLTRYALAHGLLRES